MLLQMRQLPATVMQLESLPYYITLDCEGDIKELNFSSSKNQALEPKLPRVPKKLPAIEIGKKMGEQTAGWLYFLRVKN